LHDPDPSSTIPITISMVAILIAINIVIMIIIVGVVSFRAAAAEEASFPEVSGLTREKLFPLASYGHVVPRK
jgi:type III secretory pathway component EscV